MDGSHSQWYRMLTSNHALWGRQQERYEEAIEAYGKAQEIRHKLFPGSREVGFCIGKLARCYFALGDIWMLIANIVYCRTNWKMHASARR